MITHNDYTYELWGKDEEYLKTYKSYEAAKEDVTWKDPSYFIIVIKLNGEWTATVSINHFLASSDLPKEETIHEHND